MNEFYLRKPIAHRGLHNASYPENSLAAFGHAIENDYPIELDIHLSKDGIPVVFHDNDLARMTGSNGKVSQYTIDSLKTLRLAGTNEEIPTLQEVLDFVDGRVAIIIEVKVIEHNGILESEMMKCLVHYNGEFTIQSFNPLSLRWVRKHYPNTILGLLVTNNLKKTNLNFFKKIILKYMFYLPQVRPDYIGLDYLSFSLTQFFLIKKLTLAKVIFWTIDAQELHDECRELCDNIIFENFIPVSP